MLTGLLLSDQVGRHFKDEETLAAASLVSTTLEDQMAKL